jgi:hypothetical protein
MKPLTRSLAAAVAVLLLWGATAPQSQSDDEFTPRGSVTTEYDRFEGKTTVALNNMRLERSTPPSLILFLRGYYSGTTPKIPSTIGLSIASLSLSGYDLPTSCTLNIISDGEHKNYELPRYKEAMYLFVFYAQAFRIDVPYEEFRSIAKSKSVEMRFCKAEFKLTNDQLSQFTEFRKRLGG